MLLKFQVKSRESETNKESVRGFKALTMRNLESRIMDLQLNLESHDGVLVEIPIPNTNANFHVRMDGCEWAWFTYQASNADYELEVALSHEEVLSIL